jgi:4-hydroxy-3-polyprenylbenzoate decarboxylase
MSAGLPTLRRLVIAITGASGAIYGIKLLEQLREIGQIETHALVTSSGWLNLKHELDIDRSALLARADVVYNVRDLGATLASGSFKTDGMIVAPCSMKTLAAIAHGLSDNLVTRAADVTLKERRRLVLVVRETPLNLAHLRNMAAVTEMGGIIFPPVPAFYTKPRTIDELVSHTAARILDLFQLAPATAPVWMGLKHSSE